MSNVLKIPQLKLSDDNHIPLIAYGTGSAMMKTGNSVGRIDRTVVEQIKTAIKVGHRHIDTAEIYGTEAEVGVAIQESGISRSELFISNKVFDPTGDIEASFQASTERLQVDYLDLYMIHQPFTAKTDEGLQKAWAVLEKIQASGKAKLIGVSNFNEKHLEAVLKTCKTPPVVNQVEHHPYLQREGLLSYLKSKNIVVAAYSPQTPLIASAKPGPLDDELLKLSEKHHCTKGQLLLKWSTAQNIITVFTTSKEQRMREALTFFDVNLTDADSEEIRRMGSQKDFRRWFTEVYAADDFS